MPAIENMKMASASAIIGLVAAEPGEVVDLLDHLPRRRMHRMQAKVPRFMTR